jgi:OOP family OmpA-OmpF porin
VTWRSWGGSGAATGTVIAVALLATGCGFELPEVAAPCEWMDGPPEAAGRTAIIVDTSNSTRSAARDAGAPDYAVATEESIRDAVERRDTVSVASFSGTEPDLRWSARDRSTDWKKDDDNPENQGDRKEEAVGCLTSAVAQSHAAPPTSPGTDILRPLRTAADWLRQADGEKHLILATDGLATIGCANLVKAGFSSETEIDAIVEVCLGHELAAASLAGINVALVGIGHSSPEHPVPTTAQVQWLEQLWERLCAEAGATSGNCRVSTGSVAGDPTTAATLAPELGTPAPEVSDPAVTFGDTTVVYAVPSAALFDTASSEIKPSAVPLLVRIAVEIRTDRYGRAEVHGYADPRGEADYNRQLSQNRADEVKALLLANQVTNVEAHGHGETTTCPDRSTEGDTGAGATDQDLVLQCARRVDIIVTRG